MCQCLALTLLRDSQIVRAAERAEGVQEKGQSAQKYSRRGQLINGVQFTSKCFNFVYANRESSTDYSTQAFTH